MGLNWVFYKLREWVLTETGKGDRWEGDRRLGRSEPAFRVASTTALPPPTCTARREAGQRLLAVVLLRGLYRLCSPAAALFCRLCVPARLCHAMPTALLIVCPFQFCFAPCPCPCAPGSSSPQVVRTVPLAAATRACSGGPCTGSPFDFLPFFLQSPLILGHG